MSEQRPAVLLALSPIVEQSVAPLLFGEHAAVNVVASLVELAALERTLHDSGTEAVALLVSADLSGFTPGPLGRARSHGLRVVGIATRRRRRRASARAAAGRHTHRANRRTRIAGGDPHVDRESE